MSYLIDKFFLKYNVDVKYFLIFVLFFKDLIFSNKFKSGYGFVETWDMLKRQFVLKLLNVHFADSLVSVFSFCYSLFYIK